MQVLLALLLIVAVGFCIVHLGASSMMDADAHDLCASLGTALLLAFTLVAVWVTGWLMVDPVPVRYAALLHRPFPPPER
ncbi:MAG TPA: hypothetical protein VFN71_14130 [Methylomirabilota bacterium]|nr:hypothetical protein [Methylomirabilota bacterium]